MWEKEASMGLWEFIVVVVGIGCTTKIISRWLQTRAGVTQRHVQALEQRIQVLETDVHKRLGVLEEIFVTEDIELQRKLRSALGSHERTPSFQTDHPAKS
jgi:hypothetical protein